MPYRLRHGLWLPAAPTIIRGGLAARKLTELPARNFSPTPGTVPGRQGAALPVVTYRTFVGDIGNLTTYSFASVDVGTKPCLVLVAFHCGAGAARTLSSGTVDGSAATVHGTSTGNFANVAFMSRAFTPGGTITIDGTWSGACTRGGMGVWTIENLQSNTPTGSDFTAGGNNVSRTRTVAVSAGGVAFFAGSRDDNTTVATSIDVGTITERYDADVEANGRHIGADTLDNGGASPVCTMNALGAMCGISFR